MNYYLNQYLILTFYRISEDRVKPFKEEKDKLKINNNNNKQGNKLLNILFITNLF
jgi:hypothetical protein